MKLVAALATLLVAGCTCGVADDYAKGTTGEWVVTRMFTYTDPCPSYDPPEQLLISISEDGVVTSLSPDLRVEAYLIHADGDRQLVDLTVAESWYSADEPFPAAVTATYSLELIPITARLEGTVATVYNYDTPDFGTTCHSSGAATAGRTAP